MIKTEFVIYLSAFFVMTSIILFNLVSFLSCAIALFRDIFTNNTFGDHQNVCAVIAGSLESAYWLPTGARNMLSQARQFYAN